MDYGSSAMPKGGADVDRQLQMAKSQLDLQYRMKSLQKMAEKCFDKCITKPGTSLDNSSQKCLDYCMDRYTDTEKLVSQTLVNRLQQHQ